MDKESIKALTTMRHLGLKKEEENKNTFTIDSSCFFFVIYMLFVCVGLASVNAEEWGGGAVGGGGGGAPK